MDATSPNTQRHRLIRLTTPLGPDALKLVSFQGEETLSALFSNEKRELWAWKTAIIERLAALRLVIHESRAQVLPTAAGIPWLGFVVFPTHRRVKARKVRHAHRRLRARLTAYHAGDISFAELDAAIQG